MEISENFPDCSWHQVPPTLKISWKSVQPFSVMLLTDRQRERDRQTDRQKDRQTDKQTNKRTTLKTYHSPFGWGNNKDVGAVFWNRCHSICKIWKIYMSVFRKSSYGHEQNFNQMYRRWLLWGKYILEGLSFVTISVIFLEPTEVRYLPKSSLTVLSDKTRFDTAISVSCCLIYRQGNVCKYYFDTCPICEFDVCLTLQVYVQFIESSQKISMA